MVVLCDPIRLKPPLLICFITFIGFSFGDGFKML